jgi:hypothetical protein
LTKKGDELEAKQRKIDERNAALRTLAIDLAFLRKSHEQLIRDNEAKSIKL